MARCATGTTLSLDTSTFTAELTDISESGHKRESLNSSHLGTTSYHTKGPSTLVDAGQVTIRGRVNLGAATTRPPIKAPVEEMIITEPDGATNTFDGFFIDYTITRTLEQYIEFEATIEVTGEPQYAAAP